MARGAFAAVLHCFTGGQKLADCAVALGQQRVVHRSDHIQEIGSAAGGCRVGYRSAGCWSKPTRRISRPNRSAANSTSRPTWYTPRHASPRSRA